MAQSNWWMYHGDPAHTGMATGSRINSGNAHTLRLLHDIETEGPVLSVPAIVDGFVYVGLANSHTAEGANGGQFLKIDVKTGDIAAKFEWSIDPNEGDTHGFMGMGCTPAVFKDTKQVFFSAFNGKLYCLNDGDLTLQWVTDLRHADPGRNQPVTNVAPGGPPAAGWSSPVVAPDILNGCVYVGFGEGENPGLFGFVFCLDMSTGNVIWVYCVCQFSEGVPNQPNTLPPAVVKGNLPLGFSVGPANPAIRGCSVWSSIAYDDQLGRIFCTTGNPVPDSSLPSKGFSNGILSLDATTGEFRGFFQALPESSYRSTDVDVDFGGSPVLFTVDGRRLLAAGCKNGGLFVLDAASLELVNWRQLLPYYNDGTQIPTVDPHVGPNDQRIDPLVPNRMSDSEDQENYSGTYSTPAIYSDAGRIYIGIGGNNYHNVQAGIDYSTTPFLRALDWQTLKDAWEMDDSDPRLYVHAQPPMYRTPGESGLSSPAVVNDVVVCSTSKVAVYAFHAYTGKLLWQDELGEQTGGFNGGYGYCMGPAISSDYVVAGGLIFGKNGGVLRIYSLPDENKQ
jgi:outer membrane protein assembly factor BamB